MNGRLNLLKPAGPTSHDCVAIVRRMTGQRKIGHTGTLDPNACGVLPLCLGKATRLIEYMDQAEKIYRCEAMLGLQTDTQDIWGTVLADNRQEAAALSEEAILGAFPHFMGEIVQRPPSYSAVKVNGRRLYSYARAGIEVKAEERHITVHDLRLLRYDRESGRFLFEICCSKGTYVRTICHDLGQLLGPGACMSFLLRTRTSGLDIDSAVTLEDLAGMDRADIEALLQPPSAGLGEMKRLALSERQAVLFENGNPAFAQELNAVKQPKSNEAETCAVFREEHLLGIAVYTPERGYQVRKVLK